MTLRDVTNVTNSSARNTCIYCYWSRFLIYGPYIRPVYTGRIYGRSVHTTRIYGPYSRKALWTMLFLYGPYIRVTSTHYPYIRAVCTGVTNAPVYTGRKYGPYFYGPYIWVLSTHSLYRIAVLYGPYIRAVFTGDRYALPVNTGHKYGP